MNRKPPEPVQLIKQRRDRTLQALVGGVPFIRFLGIDFDRRGDELTAVLNFDEKLIGNPFLPAIHGGVTAAFLETAAIIELSFAMLWADVESGAIDAEALTPATLPRLPKTIDFTVDYLRSGLPRDAYARARVNRQRQALCQRAGLCLAGQSRPAVRAGHRPFPDARRAMADSAAAAPRPDACAGAENRHPGRPVERDGAASGDRRHRRGGAIG
jgi:acyl-coenzyme A thioesterase PaaI-like protein